MKKILYILLITSFIEAQQEILLDRVGLEVVEVTTPGKLDMDILNNNQYKIKDRFWRVFLELADDKIKDQWQELVASSGLSSHMMVICRKQIHQC